MKTFSTFLFSMLVMLFGFWGSVMGQVISAGDFTFIAMNVDGDDDFAIVVLNELPDTSFYFDENVWDGEKFDVTGTNFFQWNTDGVISSGTVVIFTDTDAAGSRTVTIGSIGTSSGTFNLNATGDAIWAYTINESNDTTFVSAITNNEDEFNGNIGTVVGTGLTIGSTAVDISKGFASPDGGIYIGTRLSNSFEDFLSLIGNTEDYWVIDNNDGETFLPYNSTSFSTSSSITIDGEAGWRMLSFPITGGTVANISDDTAIQGITDGDNPSSDPNFFTYDNSGAFEAPADVSTVFGDGYGFITYFYNNTDAGSSELPVTLNVSGTEPGSDVLVTLNTSVTENDNHFTLLGNPFASNFDLSDMVSSGTGTIQNNVHFWDNNGGSYEVQDRTTPFITSSWQGFWVESSDGATEVTFPTTGKTSSATTDTYFSKASSEMAKSDINFTLSSEETIDKAIRLSFRENAKLGWDLDDASKFVPLVSNYATMAFVGQDKLQSVFSLPLDLEGTYEVPLQETLEGVGGEFVFYWSGMSSLSEEWNLSLNDYVTGERVNMREFDTYTFEAQGSTTEKANLQSFLGRPVLQIQKAKFGESPRFSITLSKGDATDIDDEPSTPEKFTLSQNYPNPFNPSTVIRYQVPENSAVSLKVYNVMGQQVATLVDETKTAGTYQVSWDAAEMASGIYYYRLQAAGQSLTRQMTLIK